MFVLARLFDVEKRMALNLQGVGSGKEDPSENPLSIPLAAGDPSGMPASIMPANSSGGSQLQPCSQSTLCPCKAHLEFEKAEGWLLHRGRGVRPEAYLGSWPLPRKQSGSLLSV